MYMNIVSLILIMRLYMYNLRPLIYDNMITFITISVNVCTKRQKSLFNDYGRTKLFIIIILLIYII